MRRDLLLLIIAVVLLRLPFLDQAVQGDDAYSRISDLAPLTARVYTLTRRSATISPPERGGG